MADRRLTHELPVYAAAEGTTRARQRPRSGLREPYLVARRAVTCVAVAAGGLALVLALPRPPAGRLIASAVAGGLLIALSGAVRRWQRGREPVADDDCPVTMYRARRSAGTWVMRCVVLAGGIVLWFLTAAPLLLMAWAIAPELVAVIVGAAVAWACWSARSALRLRRWERASGWWVLSLALPWGRRRRVRTYTGDGFIGFDRYTLPAPVADLDLSRLDPDTRWMILHWTGQEERALALARATYTPADPTWSGWAALSALALGRIDEAEQWVQRAVDDGYRGRVSRDVARALRPLHHTDAWKALKRLTR
jgi:hypothetical protein